MATFPYTTGNDSIVGTNQNDVLIGGLGDDTLYGLGGADTYIYRRGDGADIIQNNFHNGVEDTKGSIDVLEFKGIKSTDVQFKGYFNSDLIISLLDGTGSVTIAGFLLTKNYYDGSATGSTLNAIEKIKFSDGVSYNIAQAIEKSITNDIVAGDENPNTIAGGLGNDRLLGAGAADTFIYRLGDGDDKIANSSSDVNYKDTANTIDVLKFDHIKSTEVEFSRVNFEDLKISLLGNIGSVTIEKYFSTDVLYKIEKIQFSDGVVYDNVDDYWTNMFGGKGDDLYLATVFGVDAIEQKNSGVDTVQASFIYTLPENIENLILIGHSASNGTGNNLDNLISAADDYNILVGYEGGNVEIIEKEIIKVDNVIDGKEGKDTMIGGSGDDTYYVDNAGDKVIELRDQGSDLVFSSINFNLGGKHVENLNLTGISNINGVGNSLNNTILGNDGNNTLSGGSGDDVLKAYMGNDVLNGGTGKDSLIGGLGNDSYYIDNTGDKVTELASQGNDQVFSSVNFTLGSQHIENLTLIGTANINATGNSLSNTLVGNNGNNTLSGGNGNDVLNGSAGNDILIGGAGKDVLSGGIGADTVVYKLLLDTDATGGNDRDTFQSFTVGNISSNTSADKIDVSELLIDYAGGASLASLQPYLSLFTNKNGNTILSIDRDGSGSEFSSTALISLSAVKVDLATLLNNQQIIV